MVAAPPSSREGQKEKELHHRIESCFVFAVAVGVTMELLGLGHVIPEAIRLEHDVALANERASSNEFKAAILESNNLVLRDKVAQVEMEAAKIWSNTPARMPVKQLIAFGWVTVGTNHVVEKAWSTTIGHSAAMLSLSGGVEVNRLTSPFARMVSGPLRFWARESDLNLTLHLDFVLDPGIGPGVGILPESAADTPAIDFLNAITICRIIPAFLPPDKKTLVLEGEVTLVANGAVAKTFRFPAQPFGDWIDANGEHAHESIDSDASILPK